ncbi:hypothetical protein HFD88_010447 [Aspergillus terreus]|nr:hypothetical protein HFD88_010447 [Aspergillus terreus]
MRLVNTCENSTGPFKVEEFKDEHVPRYAILSHTWDEEEVSFQDMSDGNAMRKKGTELSEAINSMYRWYQDAHVCYAFLADVDCPTELASSRWFERGFTLQELIAPSTVVFYSRSWIELGTKESLKSQISDRTHIPIGVLSGTDSVEDASVAQRMSWASSRKTSRLEDEAYCLMGIFGINMPLLYGEGKAAFIRLQEEIMKVSDDYSIFCWKSEHPGRGGILADSANAFSDSGDIVLTQDPLLTKAYMTNQLPILGKIRSVNHREDSGLTGLFHAAATGNLEEAQHLLSRVKVNLQDADGRTPLSYAAAGGHSMIVWLMLLARHKAKANMLDKLGRTPLSLGDIVVHSADNLGLTPLIYAARGGHERIINMLLGRDGFQNYLKDNDGRTVLLHASEGGHVAAVRIFLTRTKIGPDIQDKDGKTPLLLASMNGHEEVARALLAYGAEVETSTKFDETPLWVAALNGHEGVVRLLLPHNPSKLDWTDRTGRTLLHWAVIKGHASVVGLLLDYGVGWKLRNEPDKPDNADAITQLLLGRGATANSFYSAAVLQLTGWGLRDGLGNNAISTAVSARNDAITRLLLATVLELTGITNAA